MPTSTIRRAPVAAARTLEQLAGVGRDDGDRVALGVRHHLGEHRVRRGAQRREIRLDGVGDDHPAGNVSGATR